MAPLPDHPHLPTTTDDRLLGEAIRRLRAIDVYVRQGFYQAATVDNQFSADVESMVFKGKWAPPVRDS